MTKTQQIARTVALGVALFAGLFGTARAADPEITPTDFSVSDAARLVGEWVVSIDFEGRAFDLYLNVVDIDGKMGATLDSQRQPAPQVVESIAKGADGSVDFSYEMPFGSQTFSMTLTVTESSSRLSGKLTEANGAFSASITGRRGSRSIDDAKRASPTEAKVTLAGNKIKITFGNLKMDSDDFETLQNAKNGEIFQFIGSRATKLFTDADLDFGSARIATENMAQDYPGVYSLWLKRVEDGWALVFNEQPDVWGSQHDPKADIAEIPLKVETLADRKEELLITLEKANENAGRFVLAWGDTKLSAEFAIAQ